MRVIVLFFLLFLFQCSWSQFSFVRNNFIEVLVGGNPLASPWGGGLNNAQFSEIDMDFDGRTDLFVFDRSDDQVRVFLSKNVNGVDRYLEAPEYRNAFPSDLQYRAALVDYNNDGLPDVFTYGIGGVKVYRNIGNSTDGHSWALEVNTLRSVQGGINAVLYVSSADIPAYVDVDGDGDIDILTFHIGGDRLEYHKNLSMELFGIPDSLKYELRNECWGNFRENETNNGITLFSNVFPCGSGGSAVPNPEYVLNDDDIFVFEAARDERHAGSTVLALDYNNSGVLDLILGDIGNENLVLLINGGSTPNTNSDMISVNYNFPPNSTPSSIKLFPSGFFVDADHDGIKDLIVTPNAKVVSENVSSVWRYKNTGTNENPNFVYQDPNFLQKDMIEVGTGSIPVLVDVNGDGLPDLIVANFYSYKPVLDKESRLAYYQNTGSSSEPKFTFVSNNQFNLNGFGLGLRIVPCFGDIDGDGDLDMILGNETGRVHLFTNTAGAGNPMNFTSQTFDLQDEDGNIIDVGTFSAPTLVDLNRDGLLDLVIGNKNGVMHYYQNTGTATNPSFVLANTKLGDIDVSPASPDGYAVPHFVDLNGFWHLFLGARNGRMHYATEIENNLEVNAAFGVYTPAFNDYNFKSYSSFFVSDINQNGKLNLFVGHDLGGVELFEHDPDSDVSIEHFDHEFMVLVYPNPAEEIIFIQHNQQGSVNLSVYDISGRKMHQEFAANNLIQLQTAGWQSGMYFIHLEAQNGMVQRKSFIVR
jgi:hypothetical protein